MTTPIVISRKNSKIISYLFDPTAPLYVVDVGHEKTSPRHSFGPAVRPYFLLHFVKSGYGYIERNGVPTLVPPGQAFVIRPNETTTYYSDETEPWEYFWISFSGEFAQKLMDDCTDSLFPQFHKSGLLALESALNAENNGIVSNLHTLLSVLKSLQKRTHDLFDLDEVETALRYLETNYSNPIEIDTLAQSLGYTRAYFTTLFTQRTGETPYNYLTKIRIKKAKEFLENGKYSIEEIAYSVGFCSISRFCDMFKKYANCTPLQYRKSHQRSTF